MTLKDKIELIQGSSSKEILNGGDHNGTPLLKYVFEVHEEVFGTACKSCSSLLLGYIQKIQNINLNNEIMSTKERKYRMKSGSVIHVRGTNNYYSDLNITDEIAEKLLKVNPNRSVLFAKMPEKALEKLAKEKAQEEKAAQEEEARAAAEEAERVAREEEARKVAEQEAADKKAAEEAKKAEAAKKVEAPKAEPKLEKVEDTPAAPVKEVEVKDAEEVKTEEAPKEETPVEEVPEEREKTDLELNMNELRAKYPHITARSKEEFLRELNA